LFVKVDETTYLTQQYTKNNLVIGQYYRFWVVARNDAGLSLSSPVIKLLAATVNSEPI
jgi:hypothetical protein